MVTDHTPETGLTRRGVLQLFGVAAVTATLIPKPALPAFEEASPVIDAEIVGDRPEEPKALVLGPARPTKLETFLRCRAIKPAHLARESGYSREHLLRIRLGQMEPTAACAVAVTLAVRRLCREAVVLRDLFPQRTVRAARWQKRAVLHGFHPFEREHVWAVFDRPRPQRSFFASGKTPIGVIEGRSA